MKQIDVHDLCGQWLNATCQDYVLLEIVLEMAWKNTLLNRSLSL